MLIASSSDQIYSRCVSGLKYFFYIEKVGGGRKHVSFKGEMICYIKILAKFVIYIILSVVLKVCKYRKLIQPVNSLKFL